MPEITKLSPQKHTKDRVNVYLDGTFAFGLAIEEAHSLRIGQTLTEAEIRELQTADRYHKAYDRVLRLLGRRARSTLEVRRYLQRKETPEPVIERVVARLKDADVLDDSNFARQWIESRCRQRPRGERALFAELREKGVSADIIRSVLADMELDEHALARKAAEKRTRSLRRVNDYETFSRKLKGYLARRGFTWNVVRPIIDEMWEKHQS